MACYKATDHAKALQRRAWRIRKGLEDSEKRSEGVLYAAGAFVSDAPGPSTSATGRGGGMAGGGAAGKGKRKAGGVKRPSVCMNLCACVSSYFLFIFCVSVCLCDCHAIVPCSVPVVVSPVLYFNVKRGFEINRMNILI